MATLEAGTYTAVVKWHDWIKSAKKGTVGLAVKVEFNDGWQDHTMTGTIWFSPGSADGARRQLIALGFNPDKQRCSEIGNTFSLIGNTCPVEIGENVDKSTGKSYGMQIKNFGGAQKASANAIAGLDALLAGAKVGEEFSSTEPAPPPPKLEQSGDACPF